MSRTSNRSERKEKYKLNKLKHAIVAVLVIALMAFSSAVVLVHAGAAANYNSLSWSNNQLVVANELTIYGSSTVVPIANEEQTTGNFVNYWDGLVASNSGWGTTAALDLSNGMNIQGQGSGTAIPALDYATGQADVGEMSRPPSDAEWTTPCMNYLQQWAVGIDSVAIVLSPDMTWFPTNLNTYQVAELFADNSPSTTQTNEGTQGNTGTTPLYATWNNFLSANGFATVPGAGDQTIQRAVRDPTSGTYDCFNNYFAVPNGYQFEYKSGSPSTVQGAQEMSPYTWCQENVNVYNTVSAGHYGTTGDYIGFISLGYYEHYGNMIGLNVAFNMANPPSGKTASPLITYYGPSGTQGATSNPAYSGYNVYSWGGYVVPNDANVKWAVSGIQGSTATGQYEAWRWLWEVTPGPIPTSGPCLAAGVWIAYMMASGTTNAGVSGNPATLAPGGPGTGNSNFVADQDYIPLDRADMAGGTPIDSNLVTSGTAGAFTVTATQTQTIPTGGVSPTDFFYFVNAYIHYFLGVYNPYIDYYASGVINTNDFFAFVNAYIQYYVSYNP